MGSRIDKLKLASRGEQLSVNGISVNDYWNGSPGSVAGAQLDVDAIQEFSVLTANYTADMEVE